MRSVGDRRAAGDGINPHAERAGKPAIASTKHTNHASGGTAPSVKTPCPGCGGGGGGGGGGSGLCVNGGAGGSWGGAYNATTATFDTTGNGQSGRNDAGGYGAGGAPAAVLPNGNFGISTNYTGTTGSAGHSPGDDSGGGGGASLIVAGSKTVRIERGAEVMGGDGDVSGIYPGAISARVGPGSWPMVAF